MPITNLAIQKRRIYEIARVLLKCKKRYENLSPFPLDAYKQFAFVVDELNLELVEEFAKAGFEVIWVQPRNNLLRVSVYKQITPEKGDYWVKRYYPEGARTRDQIDKKMWIDFYDRQYEEAKRLKSELEAKEKTIEQLCKRLLTIKKEKDELTSGLSMFGIFFNQLEAIKH